MLFRLYDWERNLDFQSVRVKNEALNPTGTFKDRRSEAIIEKARKENIDKLVLISAGNAAYSLVQYAREADIAVSAVVSETLTDTIKQVLRTICADVIEVDLSKKVMTSDDLIALARRSPEERIMDVTNGFHDAYRSIVRELKKNIRDQERPDAILMPFGGGEAMTGVMNGVSEVGWRDSTMVYGIHNRGAERLKTSFFHIDHAKCMVHMPEDPKHIVFEIEETLPQETIQELCVPKCIRAEEAPSYVFNYVMADVDRLKERGHKHIVIINSGSGKVLEEAAKLG